MSGTDMYYDYSGGSTFSKSSSPTWTFSYTITNPDPDVKIDLYIYEGGDGDWNDDTELTGPPAGSKLVGIAHVGTGSQVNIPNLKEGDFVLVESSCTASTCKSVSRFRASGKAGSGKSGKIIITS